jgi:hypothetical protein
MHDNWVSTKHQITAAQDGAAGGVISRSTLTCPVCGERTTEEMPVNACQYFYDCPACGAVLKPRPGDCCVFCSFGDVPCPPVQSNGRSCSA